MRQLIACVKKLYSEKKQLKAEVSLRCVMMCDV